MMKARARILGVALAVALAAPSSLALAQQPGGPPPAVTVSPPLKRTVTDWMEFTGQFAAVEYVEVRARVNGYLNEIHFIDGQIVEKGAPLFDIDPRPYENALASARAQIEQANANLDLAKRQLQRGADLRQKEYLAQSDYDTRLQATKVAEATLGVARAGSRDAELNLGFTHVTAAVTGRVGTHLVSVGNLIAGGGAGGALGTLLTTIVSLDPIYFNFDISEADYLTLRRAVGARLESGQLPVSLRLDDEKGWPHEGRLGFVDNQIDRSAGTIRLRATLPNPGFAITPGGFGRARLPASTPYEALMVPDQAVVTDQARKIVMTVTADGSVVPKPVTLGPLFDGLRVIRDGLGAGDKVIINGLMRARPGAKVTPEEGKIEPASAAKAPAPPPAPAK